LPSRLMWKARRPWPKLSSSLNLNGRRHVIAADAHWVKRGNQRKHGRGGPIRFRYANSRGLPSAFTRCALIVSCSASCSSPSAPFADVVICLHPSDSGIAGCRPSARSLPDLRWHRCAEQGMACGDAKPGRVLAADGRVDPTNTHILACFE
jgi:hypothetical protein